MIQFHEFTLFFVIPYMVRNIDVGKLITYVCNIIKLAGGIDSDIETINMRVQLGIISVKVNLIAYPTMKNDVNAFAKHIDDDMSNMSPERILGFAGYNTDDVEQCLAYMVLGLYPDNPYDVNKI